MKNASSPITRYTIDTRQSQVGFTVRLIGWKVRGTFSGLEGWIEYDDARPDAMSADATLPVASIGTKDKTRDQHLRSPDFFDASRFPVMRFAATGATIVGPGLLRLDGLLTIRDVTRPVAFEIRDVVAGLDRAGRKSLRFKASTRIDRFDYGVGGRNLLDQGGFMVGREVAVNLDVAAI